MQTHTTTGADILHGIAQRHRSALKHLRQFDGPRLCIDKLLAPLTPGIKPCLQGFRLSGRSFPKSDDRLVAHSQTIIRNCEDGGKDMGFVLIEDLDDVTVGR